MSAAGDDDVAPATHAYPASQSLHTDDPPRLYLPAAHNAVVPLVAPATGHAKPARQSRQLTAPLVAYFPAAHIAAGGVALVDPARHA
jgi:hypothetical protein